MSDLIKCSRCHSTKLEKYFSYNNKGQLYKLCDNCRNKNRCRKEVNVAREKFISSIVNLKHDEKYIGLQLPYNEEKEDGEKVEYHLFYLPLLERHVLFRWWFNQKELHYQHL